MYQIQIFKKYIKLLRTSLENSLFKIISETKGLGIVPSVHQYLVKRYTIGRIYVNFKVSYHLFTSTGLFLLCDVRVMSLASKKRHSQSLLTLKRSELEA